MLEQNRAIVKRAGLYFLSFSVDPQIWRISLSTHDSIFGVVVGTAGHIDHGKSTLSDRLIQECGGLTNREMAAQVLDSMDIERERGITIKAQSVTLDYKAQDGETYQLNFIDTPGHVDFTYEVSRSLAACEGALLVVDAGQGVEAQTLANCYTAMDMDMEVVPILNKIDLPQADPLRVAEEIEDIVGIDALDAVQCSAKTGVGIHEVLEEIVDNEQVTEIIDQFRHDHVDTFTLNGWLNRFDYKYHKSPGPEQRKMEFLYPWNIQMDKIEDLTRESWEAVLKKARKNSGSKKLLMTSIDHKFRNINNIYTRIISINN